VRTDHSALQWLMTFKEPEEQVAGWLEELQAYNFSVEPGLATPTQMHSPAGHALRTGATTVKRGTPEKDLRAEEEDCAERLSSE